jgi:capsular exopolysaccharide synthesis family protein
MNKRIRKTEAEISRIPQTQRRLGTFERKYRLNDAIYSYLLEKHAEAKITKASNRPDNIIIEPAHLVGNGPISPNKRKNYIVALFLGTFIPLGFLMLKKALSNKIESQDDITNLSKTPLLGKISHNKFKKSDVMFEFPKSTIAESFRTLRTNLEFYRRNGQDKVIMVTSCLENEGKSFIALNLSLSFAQLGRKTILLDFDLRKLKSYFNMDEEHKEGISTFIMSKNNTIDMINKSPYENLDYIPSGVLPPNPIELLSLNRTGTLIETLRNKYDIIVLDTAPLGQVSDAYLLINHSDIKLVVARQDTTPKKVFSLIMRDLEIKNTEKVYIVLNDNRMALEQYGYGYGYKNNKSRIFGKKK